VLFGFNRAARGHRKFWDRRTARIQESVGCWFFMGDGELAVPNIQRFDRWRNDHWGIAQPDIYERFEEND
jgi:hypothetical protein